MLLAVCVVAKVSNPKAVTKLQIGVKHKVANCKYRASKGDLLHIHYKVSTILKFANKTKLFITF